MLAFEKFQLFIREKHPWNCFEFAAGWIRQATTLHHAFKPFCLKKSVMTPLRGLIISAASAASPARSPTSFSAPAPLAENRQQVNARLFDAISRKDLKEATNAVANGADVNAADPKGRKPLALACISRWLEGVRFLRGAGAQVNAQDRGGFTGLMYAVCWHRIDVVRCLLEEGPERANVQLRTRNGATALRLAYEYSGETTEMYRLLKAHGAVKDW